MAPRLFRKAIRDDVDNAVESDGLLCRILTELAQLGVIYVEDTEDIVEAIKSKAFRPPPDWAHRGEMKKAVLSILRQAVEPMTTRDIALEILVTRALDKDDLKLLALMTKRVGVALRLPRLNAIVRSLSGPGQFMLWEIARYRLSLDRSRLICSR
jgi:hypothetical protein